MVNLCSRKYFGRLCCRDRVFIFQMVAEVEFEYCRSENFKHIEFDGFKPQSLSMGECYGVK
jgi:hypothetical protein